MRHELRTLYFSAFQSHLWNLVLARLMERSSRPEQRVAIPLKAGTFPFPRHLDTAQAQAFAETIIPLPSSRTPAPAGALGETMEQVLEPFGLRWSELKVKHQKDVFFSKGSRAAMVFPGNLESSAAADDLHPRRRALRLSFELGKGSYATILAKRITEGADTSS